MTNKPEITLYGAYWCPDCTRSKQFLGEHQIPYTYVDIEADQEGEAYVIEKNGGKPIMWRTGHSFIKSKIVER